MHKKGIHVGEMYFSGFWSQGDGASFEGHVCDFPVFWKAHGCEVPTVDDFLAQGQTEQITFRCEVRGRYCHSMGMEFSEYLSIERLDFNNPLQDAAMDVKWRAAAQEWDEFVDAATKIFRGHADDLYKQLETEYEYLTSDEQVLEALIANDQLEEALERYESSSTEEGDEGEDPAPVQELLLRSPGAVPEAG